MSYSVVTITREFGSGGRTIAKKLAEELGYDYYDYELVQKIAQESGFAEGFIEEFGEEVSTGGFFSFFGNNWGALNINDQLYFAERKVILELAEKGNCIIVGRCADYILKDRKDTLNVFIYADMEWKKDRIVNLYGETDVDIEKRILEKDKRRKAYYKYYTDRKWNRAANYHISLESSELGIDTCVEILKSIVK
ncbi:MAG: cytidylate kinase-like family protein [Floccifex porci]|uniref:cytidylate kinase-like family protein n=1 Tax=Floccifex porci TaxID=2606629 RepID=UPI002A80D3A5|nr:cytidylate kinase-like family protein [Floccifex porci]MCI7803443.1 cytidylate kinase-like family protein [Erysipelotrichaceae bacterium]MDY4797427.1 cytidylate kinase-like family protein [Floccifex porci]